MKKRTVFFAFLIVWILIACGIAAAEGQTNPRRKHAVDTIKWRDGESGAFEANGPEITVICDKAPTLSEPGTFTVQVSGDSGSELWFEYGISDTGRDAGGYIFLGSRTTSRTFDDFVFYTPGEYRLYVFLYMQEEGGSAAATARYSFTVAAEAGYPTLEEKAQEIVDEWQVTGNDWQTALNLHDWLTRSTYYDQNYEYYGADVLFRGKGVCDSYSKAFKLLCNTAGITVERVTSDEQGHAWNVMQLGGIWYQVDVTWDDPTVKTAPTDAVSGREHWAYFCLSDDVLYLDHTRRDASYDPGCPSMEMNYYLVMDAWQVFGNYDSAGNTVAGYFQDRLERGYASAYISFEDWKYYWPGDGIGYGMKEVRYAIYTIGLQRTEWTLDNDSLVADFELNSDDNCVTMNVTGWDLPETGTLTLPPSIAVIAENAFEGIRATTVVIPDGCSGIETGAFRNSGVRKMFVPGTVTTFAEDAFDGCERIFFILDTPDSEFADFARQKGHLVSEP